MKHTNQKKHHMQKSSPFLNLGIGMTASSVALSVALSILLGGMNKMAGLFGDETPQKLAKEMMAGAVEGILEHFEYKLDEQKRQIERLIKEKTEIVMERDEIKKMYDELLEKKKNR